MKKTLLAGFFVVAEAMPGYTADAVPVEPVIEAPAAYYWSGFYAGFQVGYGWGSADILEGEFGNFAGSTPGTFLAEVNPDGALGGVTGGYNWQFGNMVVGLEAGISASGMEDDVSISGIEGSLEVNWLATVGPRLGYGMDRTLFYVEGGYAAADVDFEVENSSGDPFADGHVHHGGFVGVGVEHAFTDRIRVGLEYNYVALGDEAYSDVPPLFGVETGVDIEDLGFHTVAARVVFNF